MIFDCHVHLCEKGALRVLPASDKREGYRLARENPWESYRRVAVKYGIFKALAVPFPFKELPDANRYVCQAADQNPDLLMPLVLLTEDVSYLESLGSRIVGIKEHFYLVDDKPAKNYYSTYDFLQQKGLVLLLHPAQKEGVPRVEEIVNNFPRLRVILAHSGRRKLFSGQGVREVAQALKRYENLFFETSTIRDPHAIRELIEQVGKERVLFGSDFPYYRMESEETYSEEIRAVKEARRPDDTEQDYIIQQDYIFRQNFRRLFLQDVWIRRVSREDKDTLLNMIRGIPAEEREFLVIDEKLGVFKRAIENERHILLLESSDEIIGFLRESGRPGNGAMIEEIYIKPNYRRRGYAKRLLAACAAMFDWLQMKTDSRNVNMNKLAESVGFVQENRAGQRPQKKFTWKWQRE